MKKYTSVDDYLKGSHWSNQLLFIRSYIIQTALEESIKWNSPVYTLNHKNVLGLGSFQNHYGIWFFNGNLMSDPNKQLTNAQEGKTKKMRQLRFTNKEIPSKKLIKPFIDEAINIQLRLSQQDPSTPRKVQEKKIAITFTQPPIPDLLAEEFNKNAILRTHFFLLPPFKQKEFSEFIQSAKKVTTKISRLKKIKPMIESGVGLNDKYRQ